jgi:hypothetical protein
MDATPGWEDRKPAVVFVARNCESGRRNDFILQLVQWGVPVESIGNCKPGNTTGAWPADLPNENQWDKMRALQRYRVYLALENVEEPGYVTEKVTESLESGTVPIYMGAPDIDYYLPDSSIINANNFENDMPQIVATIKKALFEKPAWNSYRTWLTQSPGSWNGGKVLQAFSWSDGKGFPGPFCRLCAFGYAKRQGLHWDPMTQKPIGGTVPPNGDAFWRTKW